MGSIPKKRKEDAVTNELLADAANRAAKEVMMRITDDHELPIGWSVR